jgi:hypothetical protein
VSAAAAAAVLAGCAHVTRKDIDVGPSPDAGPLPAAQQQFSAARDAMLTAAARLPDAARRLDAIDRDCARGAYDPAKAAQPGATRAVAGVGTALTHLPQLADAEDRALTALAAAAGSAGLSGRQRGAVDAVVAAARTELTQVRALATSQRTGWTAYAELWAAESEWVYRAGAGFFPSQTTGGYDPHVAGQAYTAHTNPLRPALQRERAGLATATGALARDADAVTAAITAASGAFGSDSASAP